MDLEGYSNLLLMTFTIKPSSLFKTTIKKKKSVETGLKSRELMS